MVLSSNYRGAGYRTAGWGSPQSHRDYATAIADHHRDNPTIAFWQLVNEAEVPAATAPRAAIGLQLTHLSPPGSAYVDDVSW